LLLWNVLFQFVLGGVLSWQLMKHYPKWRPAVWALGTPGERCESRTEKRRQKLKARIDKMERCRDQRPCRIRGSCLYERVLKGDPIAMVWYGARYVKYKGQEVLST
jgi:hypothetical protein